MGLLMTLLGLGAIGAKAVKEEIEIEKKSKQLVRTFELNVKGDRCVAELGSGRILYDKSEEERKRKAIMNGYDSYRSLYLPGKRWCYYDMITERWFDLIEGRKILAEEQHMNPTNDYQYYYKAYIKYYEGQTKLGGYVEVVRISKREYQDYICRCHSAKNNYYVFPEEMSCIPKWSIDYEFYT